MATDYAVWELVGRVLGMWAALDDAVRRHSVIPWPLQLAAHERSVTGPEDELDSRCNGDPSSTNGEDDESGYDDMPAENGWPDEADEDEEDDE